MIRVTVQDLETGEEEVKEVSDDFVIVCEGRAYIARAQRYPNGTTTLTVKVEPEAPGA